MSTTETTSAPELTTMRFESDGTVGTLTLARPDALNAMSPEMIAELTAMAQWLADRAPLRALVVTGDGAAFSSGGDVNSFREGLESDEVDLPSMVRRGADMLHQAIVDFRRIPYPVIAAVNGAAAGAGFSLALMCDVRIASDRAFFAVAYGRIGAAPDGGMTYFLPRVLGPAKALELLLEDPNLSAQDALERGLVTSVVPADELIREAHALAADLAKRAPHYVRMCKRLVAVSLDNSLADHLQLERHAIADSMATADLARAVPAFFLGETPEFTGE
jgi:enoyl-CoA hydratase/carnithine racemase